MVPMLNGDTVADITTEEIHVTTKSGKRQRFTRRTPWHDAVPAWELRGEDTAPSIRIG